MRSKFKIFMWYLQNTANQNKYGVKINRKIINHILIYPYSKGAEFLNDHIIKKLLERP